MRRYGQQTDGVVVPGRNAGLKLTLQPTAEPVEPVPACEPAISGLFWFSDSTGALDEDVEAAYLLPEGAAGPVLGVAALLGETCGLPVAWASTWTPETEDGGPPGLFRDGARLIVYPLKDTAPGVLEVVATHEGETYGPILLSVLRYDCGGYGYGYCPPAGCEIDLDGLWWETGSTWVQQTPAGPWAHVVALRGQWPLGTTFDWQFNWTGADHEPTYLITGSAVGVYRPSGHNAIGDLTVSVLVTPPGGTPVSGGYAPLLVT